MNVSPLHRYTSATGSIVVVVTSYVYLRIQDHARGAKGFERAAMTELATATSQSHDEVARRARPAEDSAQFLPPQDPLSDDGGN